MAVRQRVSGRLHGCCDGVEVSMEIRGDRNNKRVRFDSLKAGNRFTTTANFV